MRVAQTFPIKVKPGKMGSLWAILVIFILFRNINAFITRLVNKRLSVNVSAFKKTNGATGRNGGKEGRQRKTPSPNSPNLNIPYKERKEMKRQNREKRDYASLDELENTLLGKYGASGYQNPEDWDDDDDEAIPRRKQRFEGFLPNADRGSNERSGPDREEGGRSSTYDGEDEGEEDPCPSNRLLGRPCEKKRAVPKTMFTQSTTADPPGSDSDADFEGVEDHEGRELESEDEDAWNMMDMGMGVDGGDSSGAFGGRRSIMTEPTETMTFRLRRPKIDPRDAERRAKKERRDQERERERVRARAKAKERGSAVEEAHKWQEFYFTDDISSTGSDTAEGSSRNDHSIFTEKLFEDIGVSNTEALRNLETMAFSNPTRIQEKTVPLLTGGDNVLISAQTGSGKTLAYLLPMLQRLDPSIGKVQAIVLAPSRELVTQVSSVASRVFAQTGLRCVPIIGGANVRNQVKKLRESRPQVVVATPGRLAELVFRLKKLRLGRVNTVVIDECDNMLQEPFYGEVMTLLEATPLVNTQAYLRQMDSTFDGDFDTTDLDFELDDAPSDEKEEEDVEGSGECASVTTPSGTESKPKQQRLNKVLCLASATGARDPGVARFADTICGEGEWKSVSVENESPLPTTMTHGLISCPQIKALELLKKFLTAEPAVESALIFVNSPHRVNVICDRLLEMGLVAAPLHGDTSKEDRKEVLDRMRDGRLQFAVTTELAARGLDIPSLTHVVNFELPTDSQHYVHRAGRCGRAGRAGLVMNFARPDSKFVVRRFGKQLGTKVRDCEIRGGKVWLKRG